MSDRPDRPGLGSGLVLGVDLDGVCADYESALRSSVAARRGVDPATLPAQAATGHFHEWGLTAEGFQEAHRIAVVQDHIFRTMAPYPGVAEALWRLSDAGVWIRVITHRLLFNGLHETSAADTAVWLDQHDIPYRDLCFIGDKATVGADLYIDDSPHIILALRDAGRTALVFDQLYNRHLDGPRVRSWADVEPLVLDRLDGGPLPSYRGHREGLDDRVDRASGRSAADADEQEDLGG